MANKKLPKELLDAAQWEAEQLAKHAKKCDIIKNRQIIEAKIMDDFHISKHAVDHFEKALEYAYAKGIELALNAETQNYKDDLRMKSKTIIAKYQANMIDPVKKKKQG